MSEKFLKHQGLLVVVSGFSGGGKGALVKKLVTDYDNYALSISMTTRVPRPGEKDGREYFFVTRDRFLDMIKKDELLEYAQYVDHFYGTPREYVEKQRKNGKDVLLEIELQGALKVRSQNPGTVLIFVTPPSIRELENRLRRRKTESEQDIRKRLMRACEEVDSFGLYDYCLVNDDLDEAAQKLHSLIQVQHMRLAEQLDFMGRIRSELKSHFAEYCV